MPQAMTDAIPLMETDGTTGRNNARDIRMQLITPLLLPDSLGTGIRNGILPRTWSSTLSQYVDLKVTQLASPGNAVQIQPGRCFLARTGQGPYILTQESLVSNYAMDTADPTNARIDVVYVRLYDQAIGDAVQHGPRLEHVNGTPAGSPVAPSVPAGAIPLAQILRPANNSTVTDANITDLRKGTALYGAPRLLLPGDSLGDAGLFVGERQVRMNSAATIAAGGAAWNEYRWCADNTWTTDLDAMRPPYASLRQTALQNIPNAAFTAITFNVEDLDNPDGHSTSVNTSRYTCTKNGVYMFAGGGCFAANSAGGRQTRWTLNGAAIPASAGPGHDPVVTSVITARTIVKRLVVGDYVELQAYQSSGGTLATSVGTSENQFGMSVAWIAP